MSVSSINTVHDIEELIKQTNNVETKAILLILYKIADALQQNTELTQQVAKDMKDQDTLITDLTNEFKASTNAINGGSKVLKYIVGILQVIILGVSGYFITDYIELKENFIKLQAEVHS